MRTDEAGVRRSAVLGLVGAVALLVIIVTLQAYFARLRRGEAGRDAAAPPPAELATLRARQLERIGGYRWVDRERGIVAIPIGRAMELVARESGRRGAGSSG